MRFKGFICAALSWLLLTAPAFAESAEINATHEITAESEPETEYIYSEISETYDSYYRLYEEVFAKQIVFYSNAANGALVETPVKLDIPANVTAELTINGEPAEFHADEIFTQEGQYSLTLKADGSQIVGGRENQVYYSFFRFRIMKPAETSVPTEESQPATEEYWVIEDDGNGTVSASTSQTAPGTNEPQDVSAESTAESAETAETAAPGGDISGEISAQVQDNKVLITTEHGTQFYCSVPPGTTSAGTVELMFLDNTDYDVVNGSGESLGQLTAIGDRGKYTVRVYDGDPPAEFIFEVIGGAVRGLTEYSVPEGCEITSASLDGNMIRAEKRRADLGRDGTYQFEIAYSEYRFTEEFVLDNVAPEFALEGLDESMSAQGSVYIRMISEDISDYSVTRDGSQIGKTYELTEPGEYTVTVWDAAGNFTSQSFRIVYRMDAMAVIVIILGAAIVAAGVVFFIRTRRKFIVR